ncbi:response regulator [Dokdonia sp. Hel_I_53]|uniref:hybrid sensor histidine kinase/response regulator transcription factor n=1 Tax=Dokdonia sp. Hel_I_53 TaxID=1566287 RepID=UPI0011996CE9|nr:response regulator [Dokdonia sp. Hel_I_53]TVZ52179.1 histidine kinase/DNA gyrase B/HSP90-like ATPase [Dokdonia sp. Hel_I_53]
MIKVFLIFFSFSFCFSSYAQSDNYTLKKNLSLSQRLFDEKKYDSAHKIAQVVYHEALASQSDSLLLAALVQQVLTSSKAIPNSTDSLYKQTLNLALEFDDTPLLIQTYYIKGQTLYNSNRYGDSQSYFLKVDSLAKKHNLLNETVVRAILARSEISRTTFTHEGVNKASELQEEALLLAKQLNNDGLKYDIYVRLADMNGLKGNMAEVKKYLDLTFPYYKSKNNIKLLHRLYFTEVSYFYELNELEKAEESIINSINYFISQDAKEELASSYVRYGNYFRKKKKDCVMAISQFKKAQEIYKNMNQEVTDRFMYLLEGLALCQAANNNYKEAYAFYQKTYETKKKLVKNANNELTRNLESKYQAEKKEQEIALLKSQNQYAIIQKTNERIVLIGGLVLTTIAGTFLFFGFKNRKKTNNKLRELNIAKSNFFANISHEFRTPISLISGPIEHQLQKSNLPKQEKHHLQMAQRNSKRLLTLVDQLLDISKLESNQYHLKVSQGNLKIFINALSSPFEFLAGKKDQDFHLNNTIPEKICWFDKDALEKIITNLLSNAVKYSPEEAKIDLYTTLLGDTLELIVKNSGVDISHNVLKTIFNRFQRADEETIGSGIGLALTKELVELHKGTITVVSDNNCMLFKVILPVTAAAFSEDEFCNHTTAINNEAIIDSEDTFVNPNSTKFIIDNDDDIFTKNTTPILLIVDDNADLRKYVTSLFDEQYIIHTAENGKLGFEIAKEVVPDIIITDLMMPQEDGLIFTKNCKSTDTTSHIPILMLTAKAGDENQLKGLETGADSYLTKPFNTEILKRTVHNLLYSYKKLQERFTKEVVLLPKDLATNSTEEKFLDNLKSVLDDKLIESDFSTEKFAQALGMSRMQLHRKLKALTGLSATEFIRTQRLKLAAQMLKNSDSNVSQVGYAVGFNNHSYFTKCFKEQYGIAPSEYDKNP